LLAVSLSPIATAATGVVWGGWALAGFALTLFPIVSILRRRQA